MDLAGLAQSMYQLAQWLYNLLVQLFTAAAQAEGLGAVTYLVTGLLMVLAGRVANVVMTAIGGALIAIALWRLVTTL